MEQKLDDFIKSIDERLSAKSVPSVLHDDHVVPSLASAGASGGSQDIQGDFQALKDSLSRINLPADLKLNKSRQGIQRQDQPVFNVLCKYIRYNETLRFYFTE